MTTLQQGIAAAKAGNKRQAQEILQEYLRQNPKNEAAWWWLASVLEKEDAIICLRNVLKINPGNQEAELALARLKAGGSTADLTKVFTSPASGPKPRPKPKTPAVESSNWRREEELASWLDYVEVLHKQGQNRGQIENDLMAKGLPREYVVFILKSYFEWRRKDGLKKMIQGGAGCLGGLILWALVFFVLFSLTGSIYVMRITWFLVGGMILIGGARLIGGFLQFLGVI